MEDQIDLELGEQPETESTGYPSERSVTKLLSLHKRKIIFSFVLLIVGLIVLVSVVTIVVPILVKFVPSDDNGDGNNTDNNPPPGPSPPTSGNYSNYQTQELVKNSAEYQIVLSSLSSWEHRIRQIDRWLAVINQNNSYVNLQSAYGNSSARNQYHIDTIGQDKCNCGYEFRVRDYVADYWAGNTYIDIKGNNHDKPTACNMPFWPANVFVSNSSQKCEWDVHSCNTKYSRETRVTFDYHKQFNYCKDLYELYPWAFNTTTSSQMETPISPSHVEYWWLMSFKGVMDGDTSYEISFTLRYNSANSALHGTDAPSYGEWSTRIFTVDNGHSDSFNQDVVDAVNASWLALQAEFGNADSFGGCS